MNGKSAQKVVRFDWAIKTILRDKANFDVLEGFLSALLDEPIQVLQILESESNQEAAELKYNRVDILVLDQTERRVIIEVQNERESDYLQRLLFGTCKVVVDNQPLGSRYKDVAKVISISIMYFNFGRGRDYVYYGGTEFIGRQTGEVLSYRQLVGNGAGGSRWQTVNIGRDIFPEYYLIQVERFEDVIQTPLDEWIYMLKHAEIPDEFNADNIDRAREKLSLLKMDNAERRAYEKFIDNWVRDQDVLETAVNEGIKKGRKEGRKEEQRNMARRMKAKGYDVAEIIEMTGLSFEEIEQL